MTSTTNIPIVDIDPTGVFKYILLNVYDKAKNEAEPQMVIVRGYKRCNYHSDIYDEVKIYIIVCFFSTIILGLNIQISFTNNKIKKYNL